MTKTSKLNLTFLIITAVSIAGAYIYAYITMGIERSIYSDLFISQLFVLLPAWIYTKAEHWNLYNRIGRGHLKFTSLLCILGIYMLSMPILSLMNLISTLFVPNAASTLLERMVGQPAWLNILFLAVIPAISEEFAFRGVFFNGYRRHGFWKAALTSGLVFGLLHLNFNQFSYGFVLGVILAATVEASGSIYSAIIIHFLINFQSARYVNALSELGTSLVDETSSVLSSMQLSAILEQAYAVILIVIITIAAIIATALLVLLIKLLAKQCEREDYFEWVIGGGEREVLKKREHEKLIDVNFIAAVLICIIYMVYSLL